MSAYHVTRISPDGIAFIAAWEGFRNRQYLDAGGVPTIGFGTTASVVDPLPDEVTRAQALNYLDLDISRSVAPAILAVRSDLDQFEFDALASFGYNLGPGLFGADHTIGADLRTSGFRESVPRSMMLYVYDGRWRVEGLVERRKAEARLWTTGRY